LRNDAEPFAAEDLVTPRTQRVFRSRDQAEGNVGHGVQLGAGTGAFELEGGAAVVHDARIARAGQTPQHGVCLVPGAGDRVVTVPLLAKHLRQQVQVAREQHAFQ
jgi:hypothetical protein